MPIRAPLFLGLLASVTAEGRSLEAIKASGELRICLAEIPYFAKAIPTGCKENCRYESPHFELVPPFLKEVAAATGAKQLRLVTRTLPSFDSYFVNDAEKLDRDGAYTPKHLRSGDCDLFPESFGESAWRLRKVNLLTFNRGRMMVLTHSGLSTSLKRESDLAGRQAIVETGSVYETWIQDQNAGPFKDNPIKILRTSMAEEKFRALESRKVDFTIIDVGTALQVSKRADSSYKNLAPAFPIGTITKAGWAFAKSDTELMALASRFFEKQSRSKNSEMDRIWKQYFGVGHAEYLNVIGAVPER